MKTMIFNKNIKEFSAEKKEEIKRQIEELEYTPTLAIVQVGNNEASNRYVRNKVKDCEEVGIEADVYVYDESVKESEFCNSIWDLNIHYDGIIVQLPLPVHLHEKRILEVIDADRDVDGFRNDSRFYPCTPKGIVDYLQKGCRYSFTGKNVTIIGRSNIVGKPLARMLTDLDATVTLCHSKTKDLERHIEKADLVICAVGKANFLDCGKYDVPIVDVGINFVDGKLVGDCYNTEGKDVTPVPGGVGLLTRVALLENVLEAVK